GRRPVRAALRLDGAARLHHGPLRPGALRRPADLGQPRQEPAAVPAVAGSPAGAGGPGAAAAAVAASVAAAADRRGARRPAVSAVDRAGSAGAAAGAAGAGRLADPRDLGLAAVDVPRRAAAGRPADGPVVVGPAPLRRGRRPGGAAVRGLVVRQDLRRAAAE